MVESEKAIKQVLVKYPDCNATENLFGGKLLSWIDEAAAIFASRYMEEDLVVTKKFGELIFQSPAELRKVVTIYVWPVKEGKTSLTVGCRATKRTMGSEDETILAETELVFVAVDSKMNKRVWKSERFEQKTSVATHYNECPRCSCPNLNSMDIEGEKMIAYGCSNPDCQWSAALSYMECPSCNNELQSTHLTPPDKGIVYGCTSCSWSNASMG